MALAETAQLIVKLDLKDGLSRGLKSATTSLGRFDRATSNTQKALGRLGHNLERAAAVGFAAAAAGITASAKAAIDFEDAFAGVVKTVDEADLRAAGLTFEDLAKQFRTMATEIPIAATELAAIGETAGALGIKAQDIDDFTKTVALLGVTTDLTSDAAAEALGKVGTILGLTGDQFEDFADVLVNLGNQGASTESEIIEITKRFAAAGKQAGLATEEILALASAAASLGIEPEAAGGALSRIFANMATEIALATAKGKAFAKVTGDSMDELKRRIDEGDALGILRETLEAISGMSRTEAASVLKALGITNTRDRDAILKMAQNMGFVNDQLEIAADSTGALGKEAEKRFNTVASKIQLLKNNFTELAISIGEGMLPVIKRVSERFIAFLKDVNAQEGLKDFGRDLAEGIERLANAVLDFDWAPIGEQVRSVAAAFKDFDWSPIVEGLKITGRVAQTAIDIFNKLPDPLKNLLIAGFAINKVTGGLITGLGKDLLLNFRGQTPLAPMYVSVVGGLPTGGGGILGGTGKGGGALKIAGLAGLIVALTGGIEKQGPAGGMKQGNGPLDSTAPVKVVDKAVAAELAAAKKEQARLWGEEFRKDERQTTLSQDQIKAINSVKAAGDAVNASVATVRSAVTASGASLGAGVQRLGDRTAAGLGTAKTAIDRVSSTVASAKAAVDLVRTATQNAKAAVDRVDDAMERNIVVLRNKKLGVRLYNTVNIRSETIINGRVYQLNIDRQNYYVKPGTAAIPE